MTRTPQETFLSDQALATARTAAADPGAIPVALTAANGEQCSWCDCPDGPDSPHNQPSYRCPGCPATAKYVVSTFDGPKLRYDFPACDRHHPEIIASIARVAEGSGHRPGQWPIKDPVDLDALEREHLAPDDEAYMRRQKERALHEMVLGSIRHDLEQQPSPLTVLTAARNWCTRITAAADEIAREKRKPA